MDIDPPYFTFSLIVKYYKEIASDSEKIILLRPLVPHYEAHVTFNIILICNIFNFRF